MSDSYSVDGEKLQFHDREALEAWLSTQPRDVTVIIAARSALRAAPFIVLDKPETAGQIAAALQSDQRAARHSALTLATLRASALAWLVAKYPARANEFSANAARAAVDRYVVGPADAHASAAQSAVAAAYYPGHYAAAAAAVSYAARSAAYHHTFLAAADPVADIWNSVSTDVDLLVRGHSATGLAGELLWAEEQPAWAIALWNELRLALAPKPHWQVWIDWYQRRLDGAAWPEERELVFARTPQELWDDPRKENEWIAVQLAKLPLADPPKWDFFISYSTSDEPMAREVVEVVESAGRSTFAQFKDFLTGNNFVREMQRGLTNSGRLIALYSPNYVASSHCRAEWAAAYNLDPSGEKRKIIPFKIAPVDLDPLARQIIFKDLIGLSKAERRIAILEAIAGLPPLEAIPPQTSAAARFSGDPARPIDLEPDPPASARSEDKKQIERYSEARYKLRTLAQLSPNALGDLNEAVQRCLEAMTEDITRASIVRIYSRATTLRIRLAMHDRGTAAKGRGEDHDDVILPLGVAEPLRDFVGEINLFLAHDDEACEYDKKRLGPGEASALQDVLAPASTIVEGLSHAPEVATEAAREMLAEQLDAVPAEPKGLLEEQAAALARDSTGNFIVELLRRGYKAVGAETATASKGVREGVYRGVGGAIAGGTVIANWPAIVQFITEHAQELKRFVAAVYKNPALERIIDIVSGFAQ
jgi:hypothetical protein